jgi:pimeloyl-ACP methyl ester carboxylesterase
MDEALPNAHPLVQVALMDAYFTLTQCDWHIDDLDALAELGAQKKDDDLLAAASVAAARQAGEPEDTWVTRGVQIVAAATKRKGLRRRAMAREPRESITIVIHGTWARDGKWWRRGGNFFEYLRRDAAIADLYDSTDRFEWSGDNSDRKRERGAAELASWIAAHRSARVRVLAHSHGANIASLATRLGTELDRLVMLSPPVRKDYLPVWSRVRHAFNIQAKFDAVVAVARGGQWFRDVKQNLPIVEKRLKACGHSSSHEPKVWRDERLAGLVKLPWE